MAPHHLKTLFRIGVCLALASSASAEIIGVEQFDYPDGAIANRTGGTFWDYKNFAPTAHTGTVSSWDNFTNAPMVAAGRLVTDNSSAKREYHGAPESDGAVNDPASVPSSVAKAVYYRVTFSTGATLPSFVSISSSDFGTDIVSFGVSMDLPNDNKFSIKIHPANFITNSSTLATPNTTYTLVARLDYANNIASIYLNPDLNATEASQTPTRTIPFSPTNWSTAIRLASGTGGAITWDNLVVATTWDELGIVVVTTAEDEDDGSVDPVLGSGVSLREAVNHSLRGGLITFDPALNGAIITLKGAELAPPAGSKLTIHATSLPLGLTIDGNNASRLFYIGAGQTLALHGLTLTGGNGQGLLPPGQGGAIFVNASNLGAFDCTFTGNSAIRGGAIFSETDLGSLTTTVSRCTFTGNSAGQLGGAILNRRGRTLVSACTISGNRAPNSGIGGLASTGNFSTETVLDHTIVSGNSDNGDVEFVTDTSNNSFTTLGHNLVGSGNATVKFNQPGDLAGVTNPELSALGYFGGPTMTMHPLVGSPAIDAGSSSNLGGTDQRGFSRFVDGDASGAAQVDIGAVEAGPFITVTTEADENNGAENGAGLSLREALGLATAPGHRIVFSTSRFPRRIPLALGELAVAPSRVLFLDASNINGGVAIDGGFGAVGATPSRVFDIAAGAAATMQRLSIIRGKATDGADATSGNGGAGADGGGIRNHGALSLISCTIDDSRAGNGGAGSSEDAGSGGNGGRGGAIFSSGPLSLISCSVTGTQAGSGGLGGNEGSGGGQGGTGGHGGGIFSTAALSVVSSTFFNNQTGIGGDAEISVDGHGGNGGDGGAIFNSRHLSVVSCALSGNQTGAGGTAIPGSGSSTQGGNGGRGGGVFSGGAFRLTSSTIFDNQAGEAGAGSGSPGVGGNGGGIHTGGIFSFVSCTIVQNDAGFVGVGGGLFLDNTANGIVTHATIVGNFALSLFGPIGGGFYNNNGTLTLRYSVVAKNFGDTFGPFTNDTNLIGGDPFLAPLGDYGGPTFTMPPIPGSAAIDAAPGSFMLVDQRGFGPVSTPDLGAAEFQQGTDMVRYWETDWDGDGSAFGLEYTLGTDLFAGDRNNARNLTPPTFNAQGQAMLTFGRNPSADPGSTFWLLYRSTDLVSWTEIYRFEGTNQTFDASKFDVTLGNDSIMLIDKVPPFPKAFYQLAAGLP